MVDLLQLAGKVEITAAAKVPTVRILAYTGGAMPIPGIGQVVIDLAGLDLGGSVPLLADHETDIGSIVGSGAARVDAGQLIVSGTLTDSTAAGAKVLELGKAGFPWQASVGVEPLDRERIAAGQTITVNGKQITAPATGLTLVRKGRLREVSILAVGADAGTSVAIAAQLRGKKRMTTQTNEASLLPENADGLTTVERIEARWGRETWHDANGMPRQRAQSAMIAAAAGKIEYADFENEVLRAKAADAELALIKATAPKGPVIHGAGPTSSDKPEAILEAALLIRGGYESLGEKSLGAGTMQRARDLRARTMQDIMKAAFVLEGRDMPSDQNQMIRASFTTFSLPTALGNTANKLAMDAYRQAGATWRAFCAIKSAANFKTHTGVRVTDMFTMNELPPTGEINHGTLDESTYPYLLKTYAKQLRITRQDVHNDDLGMFNDTAAAFGRTSARTLNDLVYRVLLANGGSFFAAGNANYFDGAATNLQASSLATALLMMRGQTDADGAILDIVPKTLLVPPELEPTAKALLQSDYIQLTSTTAAGAPTGNVYKNALQLEVEPRLSAAGFTGYSAVAWYLFASQADAPMIVSFLNGQESPTIEFFGLDSDPNTLGVSWRVYHDFGAALADPKAAVKSKGEA
jgi:hypothetical protein